MNRTVAAAGAMHKVWDSAQELSRRTARRHHAVMRLSEELGDRGIAPLITEHTNSVTVTLTVEDAAKLARHLKAED